MILDLIHNVALLVALAVGLQLLASRMEHRPALYRLATGLLFGSVGIVGMMTPMHFAPGVIYDGRSIVLSLAGLFGGPTAALISGCMCAAYRAHLGGAGAMVGIGTVIEAAALGTGLYYLRRRNEAWVGLLRLWAFALLVHAIMMALQLLIPNVGLEVLRRVGPSVLFFYPLAFLLIVQVFLDGENRRKAEKALKDSEAKYRELVENTNNIILRMDSTGTVTFINDFAAHFFGFSRREILGRNVVGAIVPVEESTGRDLREMILDIAVHPERYRDNVNENIRKDGTRVWIAWTNTPVLDSQGHCVEILCVANDITERKRAEDALQESESKYRRLVETTDTGYVILDKNGNVLDANQQYVRLAGHAHIEEILGHNIIEWTSEGLRESNIKALQLCAAQGYLRNFETEYIHRDGACVPIEVNATVVKTERGTNILSLCRDISARKEADAELRTSETFLNAVIDGSPYPIWIGNPQGTLVRINNACCQLLGITEEDVIDRYNVFEDKIVIENGLVPLIRTAFEQGRVIRFDLEYQAAHLRRQPLGSCPFVILAVTMYPILNPNGTVRSVVTQHLDVTERKRAEAALRENEEKYRSLVETTAEWIWEMDLAGTCTFTNSSITAILGYLPNEILEPGHLALVHEEDRHEIDLRLPALVAAKTGWRGWILRWRHKDGRYRYLDSNANPIFNNDGELIGYRGTDRDITDRKEAEDVRQKLEGQLRQAQKMEAVGHLAGGVAHDFNNLLQVILGTLDLIQDGFESGSANREGLDEIRKSAERAADLTRQLLAFSRRQIIQPVNLDLNDLIVGILRMIRRVISEDIVLRFIPGERLGTVHSDKGQIEQVLMNLCVNARDAMSSGGTLTIETENVIIGGEYCRTHPWATEGRYVLLSVTDTGHGMDEATRAQVFEPFFTTKELGKGTGLGLATAYGIIKQHNGLIHVYSEPDKGTAFKIYLPIVERPAENVGAKLEMPAVGGTETILVAEDEEPVRKLVSRMLEAAGYKVLPASDGEEALRVFAEHANEIHLALLDVVMPRLGGREVMDRIRAEYPEMRFLFSSGYSENAIHTNFVMKKGFRLITKPYRKADLLRAVREALSEPQKRSEQEGAK